MSTEPIKEVKDWPLQIAGLDAEVKHQFAVYCLTNKLSRAETFMLMWKWLQTQDTAPAAETSRNS